MYDRSMYVTDEEVCRRFVQFSRHPQQGTAADETEGGVHKKSPAGSMYKQVQVQLTRTRRLNKAGLE